MTTADSFKNLHNPEKQLQYKKQHTNGITGVIEFHVFLAGPHVKPVVAL